MSIKLFYLIILIIMLCETNKSTNASIVVGFKNRKQFKVKDKQDKTNK